MSLKILNFDDKLNSIIYENLYIRISLDINSLNINIINTINGDEYETKLDIRDLNSPFGKIDTYNIILNCFLNVSNYTLKYDICPNKLNMKFIYLYNNFFEVLFKIKIDRFIKDYNNNFNNVHLLKIISNKQKEIDLLKSDVELIKSAVLNSHNYFEKRLNNNSFYSL